MTKRKLIIIGALATACCLALLFTGMADWHAVTSMPFMPLAGTALAEADFQKKVLEGMEATTKSTAELKTSYQKVLDDLDRSDKEVKKLMEELTKVKNSANDIAETKAALKKLEVAVLRNARSSFGDPMARCLANEETRAWLNGAARIAVAARDAGAYRSIPAEMRKLVEEGTAKARSLTGVDTSLGQATIPTDTFNEIFDTLLEYGDWPSLGVQRVGARTNVLPVGTARPVFYWIGANTGGTGEGSAITEGTFAGSSVTLTIQTLAAYVLASRELLADSTVDLAPYILKEMVQTINFGADTAAFISAGSANQTDAGYYGIFQGAQENTNLAATAGDGNTTVENLDLEDFVRCLTTVSPIVLKRKANWWAHPQMVARATLIRDANRRPIFQTWQEVPNPGAIGSILGYPVKMPAVAPSTNAAGQPVFAFGDPNGMAVAVRSDLELASSDDIKFAENERAFRALIRMGVKMKTKANSSTLKPFAILTTAAA